MGADDYPAQAVPSAKASFLAKEKKKKRKGASRRSLSSLLDLDLDPLAGVCRQAAKERKKREEGEAIRQQWPIIF